MDEFGSRLEKDILFTLDRIRTYERNKAIDDCIEIVKFHRDTWNGIEWAIRDIEELKERST